MKLNLHATCISLKKKGILIIGKSGSGKSDFALRAIMQKGAKLIADDRVDITLKSNKVYASCPPTIKNLLEVRGLGIINISTSHRSQVTSHKISLVIELVDSPQKLDRLPEPEFTELLGIKVKKVKLYPFELSSLEKLELACKL